MFLTLVVVLAATPLEIVKSGNDQLQKLAANQATTVDQLAAKSDEFIDFAELAKRALGEEWAKLKPAQQTEFAATMKGLLRSSYAQKALTEGRRGNAFTWGAEKVTGDEAVVASTELVNKDKYPVEYKLYRASAAGAWKIYDVVTDGVSLVETYSDQFQQLMAKKGYDGLLATLKKRKDQVEAK